MLKILICYLGMLAHGSSSKHIDSIEDTVMSGRYQGLGELYLTIEEDKVIGFYQSYRQSNFSTVFFIVGKLATGRNTFSIRTFYPGNRDTVGGTLKVSGRKEIEIMQDRMPDGGEFGLDGRTDTFEKLSDGSWRSIGYINTDKTIIRRSKGDSLTKRYLIKYDPVLIYKSESGWGKVGYISRNGLVDGWVSERFINQIHPRDLIEGKWINRADENSTIEFNKDKYYLFYKGDITYSGTYKRSLVSCDSAYYAGESDFIFIDDGTCYEIVSLSDSSFAYRHTVSGRVHSFRREVESIQ